MIEPAESEPVAQGRRPAATAAAEPPLEPPVPRPGSKGLTESGPSRFLVSPSIPSAGVLVLPTMTAPAARRRSTITQSASGTCPAWAASPNVVRMPAVSCRSLTAMGTPRSAPAVSPAFSAASARAAASSARSAQTLRKAFSSGLRRSMRSRQARVASTEEISPARMAAAMSTALIDLVPVTCVLLPFERPCRQSARIPGAGPGWRGATSGAFGPWSALRTRPA